MNFVNLVNHKLFGFLWHDLHEMNILLPFFVMHCLIPRKGSSSKDEHIHIPFSYSAGQIESFKNILNNDSVLEKREIISGVLQGSILGLLLFTLFILTNDLGKGVNRDTVCYWYKLILRSMSKAMLKRTAKTLNKTELLG